MATPTERLQHELDQQTKQLQQEVQQRQLLSQKLAESEARCRRLERREVDRRHTEAALHHNQARFRHIAATAPGMIYDYVLRPDGSDSFLYVSPRCLGIFEIEPADLLQDSHCLWNIVDPEDLIRVQATVQAAIAHHAPLDSEFRITTLSGKHKWIQAISHPGDRLCAGHEPTWSGFMLDITRRKQAELELWQTQETAIQEATQSAKDYQSQSIFLKTLTHDLRTPLNAILGFSQILCRDRSLTAKQQDHLQIIHRSAADLLASINRLLEISKSDSDVDLTNLQNILATEISLAASDSSILEPSLLDCMSDEWLQQLHQAVIRASGKRLLELVEQIPEDHLAIAISLSQKINDFDFEQIIELTQQAMKQRGLL